MTLKLRRFRAAAETFWRGIPAKFRQGALLMVHAEAEPDPEHGDVFLLGACEPQFAALEEAFAAAGDPRPGDRQSILHLWYGSFVEMQARAVSFDWQGELHETILHELTHHWEQRAGLDALDRFDAAQIINFARLRGQRPPMYFWRDGEAWGEGRWHIDGDVFVEVDGPPPWTVMGEDGREVVCSPEPDDGFATVAGRGAIFDGARGDLIVAPRAVERPGVLRRMWRRVFGEGE